MNQKVEYFLKFFWVVNYSFGEKNKFDYRYLIVKNLLDFDFLIIR